MVLCISDETEVSRFRPLCAIVGPFECLSARKTLG